MRAWRLANQHRPSFSKYGSNIYPTHCRLCASNWRISIRYRFAALGWAEKLTGVLP